MSGTVCRVILALVVVSLACAPSVGATPPTARGIWAEAHKISNADLSRIRTELGYGFVYAKPSLTDLDRIHAAGLKAAVWLGGYKDGNDSSPRCVWRTDDATLTTQINAVKTHPAVAYYFVDDEPHANVGTCADTPGQIRERNALIKSLDPVHPTFITENRTADYDELANTTDIMGLIGYPCNWKNMSSCSSTNIPGRVQAAEDAGVQRYWGVPQVFEEPKSLCSGAYYRFPSATQYRNLIDQWRASRQEGEFAFMYNRVYRCGVGLSEAPTGVRSEVAALNR